MGYPRLLWLVLILLATAARGQEDKNAWKPPKHTGRITAAFDRTKDQTKLSLALMPVTCVKDGCVFFNLESTFAGNKLKAPIDRILVGIAVVTKTLKPFTAPKLVLYLDGEPMDVGEMTFAGEVPAGDLTGLPYTVPLTGEELGRIAGARKWAWTWAASAFLWVRTN